MKFFKYFLLLFIIVLIGLRLALPHFLLRYVERQINKLPEYHVQIADLDVNLYRCSYTLKNIQLWKTTKNIPVPYFESKVVDFSLQWKTLLEGKFVAKIVTQHSVINFVTDPSGRNEQLSVDDRWLDIVKTLFPLNINRLEAEDGEIYFRSYRGHPPFNTYIKNIQLTIENMQNVKKISTLLPSSFQFTGNPMGGGQMRVTGQFNPFDKQPTFYLKGNLSSLNVSQIANLLKHYSDIDVIGGTFSLYGEIAAAKGEIKGYVKPFFKNLKIGNPKKESPLGVIYNGVAAVAAKILENPQKKTVATKIILSGRIDDPNTSLLSIIGYLIQNAFIHALLPQIDHSVAMQDVLYGKQHNPPPKFPLYRD